MKIYVACLSSYNNGVLHGAWIDAESDVDTMQAQIDELLRKSRFPNVYVDCPVCEGTGHQRRGRRYCTACGGKGQVPSAEEWAIHDYEGFPRSVISEYTSLETVAKWAELLDQASDTGLPRDVVLSYVADNTELLDSPEEISDRYMGSASTKEEFAEQWTKDCGYLENVPEQLVFHINWSSYFRDTFEYGGAEAIEHDGEVYVFQTC